MYYNNDMKKSHRLKTIGMPAKWRTFREMSVAAEAKVLAQHPEWENTATSYTSLRTIYLSSLRKICQQLNPSIPESDIESIITSIEFQEAIASALEAPR